MGTDPLTRDRVLAMPAGPEMDELIATEVMGWFCGKGLSWFYDTDPNEVGIHHLTACVESFRPSTSLASCEAVIEWVVARSAGFRMENREEGWHCGYTHDVAFVRGSSLCHAVCRCALLLALSQKEVKGA